MGAHAIRREILVAAGIYIGGAVGLEMTASYIMDSTGRFASLAVLMKNIEELSEMVGIGLFAQAFLDFLAQHIAETRLQFAS